MPFHPAVILFVVIFAILLFMAPIIIFPLILIFALFKIYFIRQKKRHADCAQSVFASIPGFSITHLLVGTKGESVALDEKSKKLALYSTDKTCIICNFNNIISVDKRLGGHSATKTNRISQIVSAGIGYFLFKEKGFIVGGETGSKNTYEIITSIDIDICVNSLQAPMMSINLYNGGGINTGSRKYKIIMNNANEWISRFRAIMT